MKAVHTALKINRSSSITKRKRSTLRPKMTSVAPFQLQAYSNFQDVRDNPKDYASSFPKQTTNERVQSTSAVDSPVTPTPMPLPPAPIQSLTDDLRREQNRLNTFTEQNWQLDFLTPESVARAGFYYIGPHDRVKCNFCRIEIGRWEPSDDPIAEHQRLSPNCSLMLRSDRTNIPIDKDEFDRLVPVPSYDTCGRYSTIVVRPNAYAESTYNRNGNVSQTITTTSTLTSTPPTSTPLPLPAAVSATTELLHSLQTTTTTISSIAAAAAAAVTRARASMPAPAGSNGGSLRYPDHPEYAIEASRLRSFEEWPRTMRQKPQALTDAGFFYTGKGDRVMCFSCSGGLKDWEETDVPWEQHALWYDKCEYLRLVKGTDYIRQIKEQKQCPNIDVNTAGIESKSLADMTANKVLERKSSGGSGGGGSSDVGCINNSCTKSQNSVATDIQGICGSNSSSSSSEESSKLCKICYNEEYNTTFLPCGHVIACAKCALSVTKCPLCRKPFTDIMRIYFS